MKKYLNVLVQISAGVASVVLAYKLTADTPFYYASILFVSLLICYMLDQLIAVMDKMDLFIRLMIEDTVKENEEAIKNEVIKYISNYESEKAKNKTLN